MPPRHVTCADSVTGWTQWLMHQKDGVMRKELLPLVCAKDAQTRFMAIGKQSHVWV
jgi:hypothetical protein